MTVVTALVLLFVGTFQINPVHSTQQIPEGLSDTATARAWDDALRRLRPDEDITFNENFDTPAADQLFTWMLNYTSISDTQISDDRNGQDTTVWKNDEIPYRLVFIETYDNSGKLVNYEICVSSDTFNF